MTLSETFSFEVKYGPNKGLKTSVSERVGSFTFDTREECMVKCEEEANCNAAEWHQTSQRCILRRCWSAML